MKYQSRISLKFAILLPLTVVFLVFSYIIFSYSKSLNNKVNEEYVAITDNLDHAVKLLSAMNYSFATYFDNRNSLTGKHAKHTKILTVDGLCQWNPTEKEIQSAYRADARKVLQLDYGVKGLKEACNPNSNIYEDISSKLVLAPTFSFLNGLEDYILGLYYASPKGYMITSPGYLSEQVTKNAIPALTKRDYWLEAKKGVSSIRVNGPNNDFVTGKQILTISAGLFDKDKFQGLVMLDILVEKIHDDDALWADKIRFVDVESATLPETAWFVKRITLDGVKTHQIMYYKWSWSQEVPLFFKEKSSELILLILIYIISSVSLIYIKVTDERKHFERLSQRDPLTSLLNRRGFEQAYRSVDTKQFEGLVIFDIDNFKAINDQYGHDVGDEVICAVATTLNRNTRSSDIVARFGGEEFVVYMQGENAEKMIEVVERLQKEVSHSSGKVIENGYTISGGLSIKRMSDKVLLDELVKLADNKLYTAKSNGKNQVVI